MIPELTGEYRFLSNFWSCSVTYDGVEYPSVENAYQAAKCLDAKDRPPFLHYKSSKAKQKGRLIQMRPDWDEVKVEIMHHLVAQKFAKEPLKSKLLATAPHEIEEGNWWGDTFWGTCNGVGENVLGKILVRVRDELEYGGPHRGCEDRL
jgi:ribA/ribD-fused uncharacterized protein